MKPSLQLLIPEHLQGLLSEADELAILERAAADPDFANELDFQKKAAQAIRDVEYLRMKKILRDEDALLNKNTKNDEAPVAGGRTVPMNNWKRWAAAAAIAALTFSGWWLFLRQTPEKLFALEFKPYENILADEYGLTERADIKAMADVERAFFQLKEKKYALAAAEFEHLVGAKKDPRFQFWQAQALAADGHPEAAISLLKNFVADPKSTLYGAAHWYIALSYLRAGDEANARNYLEKVVSDPLIFERKKEAAALLEKLK